MKKQLIEMTEIVSRLADALDTTASADIGIVQNGAIRGYIVSPSRYQSLRPCALPNVVESQYLADEYVRMAACMQTPEHANAVERLMTVSADELRAFFSTD